MFISNYYIFYTLCLVFLSAKNIYSFGDPFSATLIQENEEYCETETFTTKCPEHHAVLITKASYGRTGYGKCVLEGYSDKWCNKDVLIPMDNICSGKKNCEVRIPDKILESATGCKDFKNYLNVSYRCVEVEHDACFKCRKEDFALVKYQMGYLASFTSFDSIESNEKKQCGTVTCPWKIEVMVGQTIKITLYDFTIAKTNFSDSNCFRLAVIKEKPYDMDTPVCGGKTRIKNVYQSVSNSIELYIMNHRGYTAFGRFFLKYEAVGCADFEAPINTRTVREKDTTEISCGDGQKWVVKCEGSKWVGEYGVCASAMIDGPRYIGALSVGLLTAIVIGIALVIAVLIVTIGVVCLKKHHQDSLRSRGALYVHPSQCYELRGGYQRANYFDEDSLMRKYQKSLYPTSYNVHSVGGIDRRNVYDVPKSIESRPLPSIPVESKPIPKIKQIEAQLELKSHKYQSVIVSTASSTAYEPTISKSTNQSQIPSLSCSSGKSFYPTSHYTVLDSAAQQHQSTSNQMNASTAGSLETGALTWAVPDPQSTAYSYASSSQGGSDDGFSSKDSGVQNANKNISNVMNVGTFQSELYNSQIPLRPMREGSQAAVNNVNNFCTANKENDQNSIEGVSTEKSFSTGTNSWP